MSGMHFVRIQRHFRSTVQTLGSHRDFINLCVHNFVAMVEAACALNLAMRSGRHGYRNGAPEGLKDRVAHPDSDAI